ncbi:MAG: Binding-protein-dependent transport systems inner membrane component [Thermotoga sp. 50_1627]|nr:MAG: Binding-protein-dependent transport systems inner membrane component [Thermotoga sp. 50_64]KUK24605.1 MAG: Binding-protein-dependent transport systems inner membrane component [Thermotoga sp. 50_1627]
MVFVVLFFAYLLFSSFFISLRDVYFGLIEDSTFIGIGNYARLMKSRSFWDSMRFSLTFGLVTTFLELVLGFALAYFFYSKFRGMKLLFTLLITPMFIAPSLFGLMNRILFNNFIGIIPGYMKLFFNVDIDFFSPKNVFWTLVGIDVLQWTSFVFLIIYAALLGVPVQLIEASSIDGAATFQKIWYVVLPYIKPSIMMAAFLRFLESFRVFDSVYVLTGGGPGNLTTSISIFIYRTGFTMGEHGLASAAGMILFLSMLVPVLFVIRLARRRW